MYIMWQVEPKMTGTYLHMNLDYSNYFTALDEAIALFLIKYYRSPSPEKKIKQEKQSIDLQGREMKNGDKNNKEEKDGKQKDDKEDKDKNEGNDDAGDKDDEIMMMTKIMIR